MTLKPENFNHQTDIQIRFADIDAMNHVNNAMYLTYMEQARVRYFRNLRTWDGDLADVGPILAKTTIEYKLPLTLEDEIATVWTRCSRLGNKSFDIEAIITRASDGAIAAQATFVLVVYNYKNGTPIAIPQLWRENMLAYEPALSE